MPNTAGFNNSATGVFAPNRNNMHGTAKYSTKLFKPGTADSANQPTRVAINPAATRAKNGNVTESMFSMAGSIDAERVPALHICYGTEAV